VRLFVALEIPSAVREMAVLLDELRTADAASLKNKARWVRAENLHVTLKFIGNVDAGKLDAIRAELAKVGSGAPVELRFHRLGFFPNERRPRVLWVGVESSPNLAALAAQIDALLSKSAIPRETRDFSPHLTLARFDPPGISEALHAVAQKNITREFGSVRTGEFHLFESKTRPAGAEYTRLSSFSFVRAEA
jgi:2'-5' RNA ligase